MKTMFDLGQPAAQDRAQKTDQIIRKQQQLL
jgi:hypothetical protein